MPRNTVRFRMNIKLGTRLKREARKIGRPPERLILTALQRYLDLKQARRQTENPDLLRNMN